MWKSFLTDDLDITPESLLTATPHKLMLHMIYWWLFILLHRPFFHRDIDHVNVGNISFNLIAGNLYNLASLSYVVVLQTILWSYSIWRALYKLRYCPVTLIQIAFSAGTVYLLKAMQPNSGTRISLEELRQSLDQETLVQKYLQEMGLSWDCATKDSDTLRKLKNEQVGPLLDFLDQRSFVNLNALNALNADLCISANINEAKKDTFSSLPNSSYVTDFGFFRSNPEHTISCLSSLSTPPKYFLSHSTSPNQVSPFPAYVPISSAPITIRSQGFISEPASFASPWSLLSSENSSGGQRSSLVHNSQPSGQGSAPKIKPSDQSSAANIQPSLSPSSRNRFLSGYLGMSGGQSFGSVFRWLFQ
jgi:hypothetical protein